MRFTFTEEDVLRGTIVKPTWYPVEITSVEDITAGTGTAGSEVTVKVLNGDYKGVPISVRYYENAPGFAKNFITALGGKVAAGVQFEFDSKLVGKKLEAYIKTSQSNKGNNFNDIADWRPMKAAQSA